MSFEPVDVIVSDTEGNLIEGVLVKIYDSLGSTFFSQAVTNVDGSASFLLETLNYSLRFYKFQVGFVQPQQLTVLAAPETNVFEITCEPYTMPIATDPRYCRCSGFFRNIAGAPQKYLDIHFLAEFSPLLLDQAAIVTEEQRIRTDADGFASIDLIRGGRYNAVMAATGSDNPRCIAVPDLASTNLPDLLFPRVDRIDWDIPGPYVLNVGDFLVLTPTVYDSAGRPLTGTATADVGWTLVEEDPIQMAVTPTTVEIRALRAGTETIVATRKDVTIIKIPNTPIEGVPLTITVV